MILLVWKEDSIHLGIKDGDGKATFPISFREQNFRIENMVTWLNKYNGTACNVESSPSEKWY